MKSSNVYSIPAKKSSRRKSTNPISDLARLSFEAFKPFINLYDPGIKYGGEVFHAITKEDWELFRRYKAGERGLTYSDGAEFKPGRDVVCKIYSARHVHRHIQGEDITYYTSGRHGLGLLYLDIDAHKAWQTDEYQAKALLQSLFPFGYFRASRRGQNGYLKIRYASTKEFNTLADRLQETMKRYFLWQEILCDFEVKGKITTKDGSGSLAKMPFGTHLYPCNMRDETDNWDRIQLEKFSNCPIVNARRIEQIRRQIEVQIDEGKVVVFAQHKRQVDEQSDPAREVRQFLVGRLGKKALEALIEPFINSFQRLHQQIPTREDAVEWLTETGRWKEPLPKIEKPVVATQPTPSPKPCPVRVNVDLPPQQSDDAFQRNLEDLPPFVRAFYSRNRRYPTGEEALEWLHDNRRYSGEWEDREDRRAKRVQQILDYLERDFDPEMLSKGGSPSVSLELGRFRWWVEQKFGYTMTVDKKDISRFDPATMTAPSSTVVVPAKFIETFLTVAEFCTKTDPLGNKAVPTNRIKKIWAMVKDGSAWNQKWFQAVRDKLHRMGVIRIVDRHHHIGKAWRWTVGENMPAGGWREEQRKFQEEHRLPAEMAGTFEEIIGNNQQHIHNTLYYDESQFSAVSLPEQQVRPPPWSI